MPLNSWGTKPGLISCATCGTAGAYGQELSAKFGLSRNTIHHHMSKLLAARLVSCTVDGNRVYYTVDRESVSDLLNRQAGPCSCPRRKTGKRGDPLPR